MHRYRAALLSLTAVVAAATGATSAFAAGADQGGVLARRWCATCHVVAPGQQQASTQAPPFSAIANKPGFDAGQLALYLLLPHPRMPDMNMSRAEAADLAAYIHSQR
jgi:mono/diheme cytochrome c family protein